MVKQIKVLLVEDNPDDVEFIRILSTEMTGGSFDITTADCLSVGMKLLSGGKFDIILLDLFLSDSIGIDTLLAFHTIIADLPVIIMTGYNDEKLAFEAVQKGAQDYLVKGQVDANLLWRSVNYAIERKKLLAQLEQMRQRERQDKEIKSLKLISGSSPTEVTAQFLGITSLKKYAPDIYKDISQRYCELLDFSVKRRIYKVEDNISESLRLLSESLGFLKAGPRDVIEIHTEVLEKKCRGAAHMKVQAYVEEGRTMLLELMGYIVMFYRNYYVESRDMSLLQEKERTANGRIREVTNNGE